jgi:hypothetical protein
MDPTGIEQRKWFTGVDLGQSQDHTAVVVLERVITEAPEYDAVTRSRLTEANFNVRHIERMKLGTPYQAVVERIKSIVEAAALAGNVTLVVDATGVGGPVVDLLKEAIRKTPIVPVVITGGDRTHYQDGRYRVPKRDLVSGVAILLESGRLKISQRLPEAKTLIKELLNMRVKISASGHEAYEAWREGEHDDLVLALALGLWRARESTRRQMGVNQPIFVH